MNNLLIFLLITVFSTSVIADDRRDRLIGLINEELKEVSRLSKTLSHRDPNLLVRLAELNLEKARLIKEEENIRFLKISPNKRRRKKRSRYFSKSRKHFKMAQKWGNIVVKRYRNYKGKAKVYYILAFNAKEFGQNSKSKSYLKSSIKYSKKGSKTYIQSTLTLAEMFYNDGKYKKALNLYKISLRKKYNKWWTKDAYNMAWCLYKLKKHNQAIETLKEVLNYSKSPNFIDMTAKVEKDMALFYTGAGKNNAAVRFYKNRGGKVAARLIVVARHLMDQEKVVEAEKVLNNASSLAQSHEEKVEINLLKLTLFEKYGLVNKHLAASKKLESLHQQKSLSDEDKKRLVFQVKKMAAILQKQVSSGTYKNVRSTLVKKGELATEYFLLVSKLENKENYKTLLHTAETQYAIGKYDKAVGYYSRAFEATNNIKVKRVTVEGMLASLGKTENKQVTDKYLQLAYSRYISMYPRGKRTNKIYEKMFSIEMGNKNIEGAEGVLKKYKKVFPKNILKQEAMLARIMDFHKNKGDISAFRNLVSRVNSGEFKVTRKYANKLKQVMLTLQFESVEGFSTKGDKLAALKGYVGIFNDVKSSSDAKKTSAYNITILYHELGRPDETIKWLRRSLNLMNLSEIRKFESTLFSIITELFFRRRFTDSLNFAEQIFNKTCSVKSKNKQKYFKNIIVLNLAEGQIRKSLEVIRQGTKCGISSKQIRESKIEILNEVMKNKNWSALEKIVTALEKDINLRGQLILPLAQLRKVHASNGRKELSYSYGKKMMNFYKDCNRVSCDIPLKGLDEIANLQLSALQKLNAKLYEEALTFPEQRYNSILQRKFKTLDQLTSSAIAILKIGSGRGIVKSYQILIESYQSLAKEIQDFRPPKKTQAYIKSFQASMLQISRPLVAKSKQFLKEARSQISKSKILSRDNYWFVKKERLPIALEYRYPFSSIIMDRGGRR